MNIHSLRILPVLAATLVAPVLASAEIAVKSGEKIAFLGDSITHGGWSNPAGYVRLVIAGLEANGIKAEPVPAGISGHKSDQMLARLNKDVLSKKPQWMTLSCGVNDVWHGPRGVPLDDVMAKSGTYDEKVATRGTYQKNITAIIDQATAAGVKPVMLTATVIHENLASKENGLLAPYNDFLRKLAKEKNVPMADLYAMFEERIKAENKPNVKVLTSDGVHMNAEGNKLMAVGVLKAFGLNEAELDKAKASWPALEVAAAEFAKKQAEARAKAAAEKAKSNPKK
ncbi:GDSL-type esterase/lipase family protein [Prosthecobacter sp.]|uniref:SGNH/GDSL hydrolase family protein n=1 Tax=Prosthecobacter sp. TaxID=1965333 RepID=UPI002AB813BC|nr:GDSL-type esterase/lipase family protein [Prosthecobacter sp.]MDZ4402854.1 GDSL-type esterase/lipase family protein [Prosthecobacter sp.]